MGSGPIFFEVLSLMAPRATLRYVTHDKAGVSPVTLNFAEATSGKAWAVQVTNIKAGLTSRKYFSSCFSIRNTAK